MENIAVFCGSSKGTDEIFEQEARKLGETLARNNMNVIYGGASIGLMNAVATAALENGGEVIGIIPNFLDNLEITKKECSQIIYTETMHERKIKMFEICDGIIVLPGGFGTLDELFEALTLSQLKIMNIPIGILNTADFYTPLINMLDVMEEKGFLRKKSRQKLIIGNTIDDLLEKMTKLI